VLSEKKILNETKKHNPLPPFKVNGRSLMEKARKAYFKIKKTIGLNNPCRLLEKIFDSLVTPILTYGSEVWGVDSTFKDSDPFEKLHIKFIRDTRNSL
jgi:hypothetical protein